MKTLTINQKLLTMIPIFGMLLVFYYLKHGNLDMKYKPHMRIFDISAWIQAVSIVLFLLILRK